MVSTSASPTRQQRDILAELNGTLGAFAPSPGQGPGADAAPAAPPARRRNPRALIVAASRVRADPDQVRRADKAADSERVQELARSIQAVGLQQPPGVRETSEGYYEVVYGEGRFTAMTQVLGWGEIEVVLVNATEAELVWHQLHENVHRTNLSPLDLAAAVQKARAQGHGLADIAARMAKSETWVQKALTIAERLGDEARGVLEAAPGRPAMDAVYAVAQVPAAEQAEVAREVAAGGLTRRETEVLVEGAKARRAAGEGPRRSGRKKSGKPFEKTLRTAGGGSVTVRFRRSEASAEEVSRALEEALGTVRKLSPAAE